MDGAARDGPRRNAVQRCDASPERRRMAGRRRPDRGRAGRGQRQGRARSRFRGARPIRAPTSFRSNPSTASWRRCTTTTTAGASSTSRERRSGSWRCAGCSAATDGDQPLDADFWRRRIDDIGGRGQRVLALASKSTISQHRELRFDDVGIRADAAGTVRAGRSAPRRGRRCRAPLPGCRHPGEDDHRRSRRHGRGDRPGDPPGQSRRGA